MYDIAVIGGGPAGLSAAIQARARNKSVLVVSGDDRDNPLYKTSRIDNYLGFYNVTGPELLERFRTHAGQMGVERRDGRVLNLLAVGGAYYLSIGSEVEQARAVVLALRRLDRAGAGALLRFRRRKERYLPPQYGGPSPLGGLAAPELTGNDLRWKLRFDRMLAANAALYEELLGGLSLDGCPPRYGVPVILTAGERDWTTPYPLAAAYYDTLSAPCKVFLSLPDAGHLPFRERPEEWSHILLDALAQI